MTAIPPGERGEHERITRYLVASARSIQESQDGLTFQLSADHYETAVQFIAWERFCCPFLRFLLEVTPERGPLRLCLEGPPGSGAFLRSELHLP